MTKNFKFVVGAALALSLFVVSAASAAYTHSTTLKLGSRSTQVMALQQTLNMTDCKVAASGAGSKGMETSYFGPATKAAVQCFQRVNALGADGVVGAMTGAKLSAIVVTDSTLPAGCSSKTGYSTTTGIKCDTTTGTGTTTPSNGSLQGGAGDLDLDNTSTDVEDTVEEGATEKVLGLEAEATDSDIAITNIKVSLKATPVGSGSTRIEKYLDEVSVWLGDKKVGSVDADEFSKNGTTYTKSISLSNAIVREDDTEKLYVAVTAVSSVDADDQTFAIDIEDVRYTDATGAILSASLTNVNAETFGFDEEGVDDELSIKNSSANPDASTLKVSENSKSDDFKVLVFKLEVDEDSSDIDVNEFPVVITLGNTTGTISSVINEVYVKVGSKQFDADRNGNGAGTTAAFDVDFDDAFSIDADDSEEVEVYVVFNKQSGNYLDGVTIKATVDADSIDAEGADDLTASNLNGTANGKIHTLNVSAADVSVTKTDSSANDTTTVGTFTFEFTVSAEDGDIDVDLSNTLFTVLGPTTGRVVTSSLINLDGDATENSANDYTVEDGDENTFSLSVTIDPSNSSGNGQYYVRLDNAAGVAISNKTAGPRNLNN